MEHALRVAWHALLASEGLTSTAGCLQPVALSPTDAVQHQLCLLKMDFLRESWWVCLCT